MKWLGTKSRAENLAGGEQPIRVLFVCLGNICRSPTAEGIFTERVKQAGLQDRIQIDSAGTGDWHIGRPPDPRASRAAANRGYDLSALRGRQVERGDFGHFDYVIAMDDENVHALKQLCPREHEHKIRRLTDFCSTGDCSVPDPYMGGLGGFEHVLDLIEDSTRGLLQHLQAQLKV